MQRAYDALYRAHRLVVIDGLFVPDLGLLQPDIRLIALPKADSCIPSVMAASILAKVARDHYMEWIDALMPEYGFKHHKGYPTKAHRQNIARYGASRFHRKKFQLLPVSSGVLVRFLMCWGS